jgi:hypothetical protein
VVSTVYFPDLSFAEKSRTHFFASPKTRNALSFLVGYSNSLGLIGGLCSIDYGFALMFCSV